MVNNDASHEYKKILTEAVGAAKRQVATFRKDPSGFVATHWRVLFMLCLFGLFSVNMTHQANRVYAECVGGIDDVTSEPCLNIDPTTLTGGLFQGANIIIAALGTIMFLLAGFALGGGLLKGIVKSIGGISF